jgi:ABC-2 type transport system permease protein
MRRDELFSHRLKEAYRRGLRYAALAVSGSNAMGIMLLLIGGSLAYRELLNRMVQSELAIWGLAVVAGWLLSRAHVRTWLRSADIALLIPTPYPLPRYLQHALRYSFIVAFVQAIILAVLLWPVVTRASGGQEWWLIILIGSVVLKAWNVWVHWRLNRTSKLGGFLRFAWSVLFLYSLYKESALLTAFASTGMLAAWFIARRTTFRPNWLSLIEAEQKRTRTYYAILNWFADIPYEAPSIKPRTRLVQVWSLIFGKQHNPMLYRYARSWLRSGEEFGMYAWVTVVAMLLLAVLSWSWAMIAVLWVGPFLSGYPMVQWARQLSSPPQERIFPVSPQDKRQALARLCTIFLLIHSLLLAVAWIGFHGLSLQSTVWIVTTLLWSMVLGGVIYPRRMNR